MEAICADKKRARHEDEADSFFYHSPLFIDRNIYSA